jgi:hypothetical protein
MRQTPELDLFFARVARLTPGELLAMIAAGEDGDITATRLAFRASERAAKDAHLADELHAAREQVIAWATDAGPATAHVSGFAIAETIDANLRRRAAPELIGAAVAIVLGGRLRADDAQALLTAWHSAVGTSPGTPADR